MNGPPTPRGLPPAIVMGGLVGAAISVARSLARHGIEVYLLSPPDSPDRYSRYIRYIRLSQTDPLHEAWATFLLGTASDHLRGAVLMPCSDEGIEIILRHRDQLSRKFALDVSNPKAQACFLNKLCTYEVAAEAGIPTPRFWRADTAEQVKAHRDEYAYPLMIKPLYSHKFKPVFNRKFLMVKDFDELCGACDEVRRHDLEVVLLEFIPGEDDRLCSYQTYMDESGTPLFDFTKRVIRRQPPGEGMASYHVTDWNPEVRDLGLRLLTHVGHRGLAHVEFKRDERDGTLKLIECNARFTGPNGLLTASGYDVGLLVYNHVVGRPQPSLKGKEYKLGLRFWHPGRDFVAFVDLRAKGQLSLRSWVASVLHPQVLPIFRWNDPLPSLAMLLRLPHRLADLRGRRKSMRLTGVSASLPARTPSRRMRQ